MAKYNGPQLRKYPIYRSTLVTVVVPARRDGNWTDRDQHHVTERFEYVNDLESTSAEAAHMLAKRWYGVRTATGLGVPL